MSGGVTNAAFSVIRQFFSRSNGVLGTSQNIVILWLLYQVPLTTAPEGANNVPGRSQPVNPAPPGFSVMNHQIHVTQLQPGGIPRNMVDILCFLALHPVFRFV
jgi:hypothetical protein